MSPPFYDFKMELREKLRLDEPQQVGDMCKNLRFDESLQAADMCRKMRLDEPFQAEDICKKLRLDELWQAEDMYRVRQQKVTHFKNSYRGNTGS